MALRVLETAPRIRGRDLVFGEGEGGYSGWSRAKKDLDEVAKVKPWRLHDLRRTCATGMADLGVQPHVIEAVLNHVSGHKAGVAPASATGLRHTRRKSAPPSTSGLHTFNQSPRRNRKAFRQERFRLRISRTKPPPRVSLHD